MKNLLIALFLLIGTTLFSQDTLKWYATNQFFLANQSIIVPVKVDNFKSISSYQYGMKYDTASLRFDSISLYPNILPNFTQENFGSEYESPLISPGNLTTLWTTPFANTIPNGTSVFKLHFTTKKKGNLTKTLVPSEEELIFEAIDSLLNEVPEIFFIEKEEQPPVTSLRDVETVKLIAFPNPTSDSIRFNQEGSAVIFDITGHIIYQANTYYLQDVDLPVSGIYYAIINNQVVKFTKL
jgi:hypothetical protein